MTKLKFNGVVTEVYTTPEKEKVNSIETGANKTEFATTSEATTATNNTKAMTPLRTKEAILALSPPPDLSGYATIIALDEKVDKVTGMGLSGNDYDDTAKTKVDAIPSSPKYTDTTYELVTTTTNGLMSSSDKTKLDGVDAGANNYTHPITHPASMITESTTKRFVTDVEKSTWNNKQDKLTTGSNITIDSNNKISVTVPVQSVNSKTGAVTITKSDVGLGSVENIGIIILSEAEYEALSDTEKARTDKLYGTY